jgi:hypothetical protein
MAALHVLVVVIIVKAAQIKIEIHLLLVIALSVLSTLVYLYVRFAAKHAIHVNPILNFVPNAPWIPIEILILEMIVLAILDGMIQALLFVHVNK